MPLNSKEMIAIISTKDCVFVFSWESSFPIFNLIAALDVLSKVFIFEFIETFELAFFFSTDKEFDIKSS